MRTKYDLLDELEGEGYLIDPKVEDAFLAVDLEPFLPSEVRTFAYRDRPLPFYIQGDSARTISAPHMISILLQMLDLDMSTSVLMLGAKSGYIAALIAEMVGDQPVKIIESNPEIYALTLANLQATRWHERIQIILGNPLEGDDEHGPWDRILLTGQIEVVPPLLIQQLSPNGLILAPVGDEYTQKLVKIQIEGENLVETEMGSVVFGPLELPITDEWPATGTDPDPASITGQLEVGAIEDQAALRLGSAVGAGTKLDPEQKIAVYNNVLEFVWSDGILTDSEAALLAKLRDELNISEGVHIQLENDVKADHEPSWQSAPKRVPARIAAQFDHLVSLPENLEHDLTELKAAVDDDDPDAISEHLHSILSVEGDDAQTVAGKGVALALSGRVEEGMQVFDQLGPDMHDRDERSGSTSVDDASRTRDGASEPDSMDPFVFSAYKFMLNAMMVNYRSTAKRLDKLDFALEEYGSDFSNTEKIKHLIEQERLERSRDRYRTTIGTVADIILRVDATDREALGARLFLEY